MARGIKVLGVFGLNWLLAVVFLFWVDDSIVTDWFPKSAANEIPTPTYLVAIYLAVNLIINASIAWAAYWIVRKDLQDIPIKHKWTFYLALLIIFSVILTTIMLLFNLELNSVFNNIYTPFAAIAIFLTIPFLVAISGPILGYQSRPWFKLGLVIEVVSTLLFFGGLYTSTM